MTSSYEPFIASAKHIVTSYTTDRAGWTRQQWLEDADRLMNDIDGSVLSLVNGHVIALLDEVAELRRDRGSP